jgi:hypothetical protein
MNGYFEGTLRVMAESSLAFLINGPKPRQWAGQLAWNGLCELLISPRIVWQQVVI